MKKKLSIVLIVVLMMIILTIPASAVTRGELDGNGHPYVGLALFFDDSGAYMWRCSGTLLSETVFMTAGHCTFGTDHAKVFFETDLSNLVYPYPDCAGYECVMGSITQSHPGYNDYWTEFPKTYDIGIVILDPPGVPTDVISEYGELPEPGVLDDLSNKKGHKNLLVRTVGYGLQEIVPNYQSDRVRYTSTSTIINLVSNNNGGYNMQTSNNASEVRGKGGSCFGDSGGPVFYPEDSNVVVGIVSFGMNGNCMGTDWAFRTDIDLTQEFVNGFLFP